MQSTRRHRMNPLPTLGAAAAAIAIAASTISVTPAGVDAATVDVVLTLSLKPASIPEGGTFTLTATLTPSQPVSGPVRVGITSELNDAHGEFHGCTPSCTLLPSGTAEWEWTTLTAKTTMKVLWTAYPDGASRNTFRAGISFGDVNYAPPEPVIGSIGGTAPTPTPKPTPKPTRRPTPAPTVRAASTAAPPTSLPTSTAEETPGTAIGSPTIEPSTSSLAPPTSLESPLPSPSQAPAVGGVSETGPPGVPPVVLLVLGILVVTGGGLLARLRNRRARSKP